MLLIAVITGALMIAARGILDAEPGPEPTQNSPSEAAAQREAARKAEDALEASRDAEFAKELESLGERMRKRKIPISPGTMRGDDEFLNYDMAREWTVVAAACLDARCDFEKLRTKYPEISRRGGVVGIEDFDRSGTRQALCQGPPSVWPLRLKILRPAELLTDRSKVEEVRQDVEGFVGDAPVTIFHRSHHAYIRIVAKNREVRVHPIPP